MLVLSTAATPGAQVRVRARSEARCGPRGEGLAHQPAAAPPASGPPSLHLAQGGGRTRPGTAGLRVPSETWPLPQRSRFARPHPGAAFFTKAPAMERPEEETP